MDPPEPLRFIQAWSSRYNKFLTISRPYTLYHTLRPEIMDKSRKTYGFILQSVQHPELLRMSLPKMRSNSARKSGSSFTAMCRASMALPVSWKRKYTRHRAAVERCCTAGFLPCASAHCRGRARSGNSPAAPPPLVSRLDALHAVHAESFVLGVVGARWAARPRRSGGRPLSSFTETRPLATTTAFSCKAARHSARMRGNTSSSMRAGQVLDGGKGHQRVGLGGHDLVFDDCADKRHRSGCQNCFASSPSSSSNRAGGDLR